MDNKAILGKDLLDKSILILIPGRKSASTVESILKGWGFTTVHVVHSMIEAMNRLQSYPVEIVASELEIGNSDAFQLFRIMHDNHDFDHVGTIVFSTNTTESIVANAVEKNIDAVISRPFTEQTVVECFAEVIKKRFQPSPYVASVEKAKALILNKNYGEASVILEEAVTRYEKPALACFLLGEIAIHKEQLSRAEEYFKKGLDYKPRNLKCLIGMVFCLRSAGKLEDAYEYTKTLIKIYPTNQKRLKFAISFSSDNNLLKDLYFFLEITTLVENPEKSLSVVITRESLRHFNEMYKEDKKKANNMINIMRLHSKDDLNSRIKLMELLLENDLILQANKELSYCRKNNADTDRFRFLEAGLLYELKQYVDCVRAAQVLNERSSGFPEINLILSKAYLALGDLEKAKQYSDIAIREIPFSFEAKMLFEDINKKMK
ncbi:MAG: hypothetical protein JXA66_06015 [Oligoflexia bacterium]|nr:hypothetical protein [Oligoflexia bacterium]